MKKIIAAIFICGFLESSGQSLDRSVVASGGNYSQIGGINLSSTVGEVAVTTLSMASSALTQGFQQPDGLFVRIVDPVTGTVSWNAYPNPVSNQLTLELSSTKNEDLIITCHDLLGRIVLPEISQRILASENLRIQMDVHQLTPAMYFVRIFRKSDQQVLETIRIIKSH